MKPALVRRTLVALVALALIVGLGWFFARIPRTVTVFVIAAFIAFGASPVVRRLEQSRLPRPIAIGVVYLGLLAVVVVIALVVIPVTVAQLSTLLGHAPDYVSASEEIVAHLDRALQSRLGSRMYVPSVGQLQAEVGTRVAGFLNAALDSIGALVIGTVSAFVIGISALVLSIFFVARGRQFGTSLLEFVPPRKRDQVAQLFEEITSIFGHFVAGQATLCGIVGLLVWLALLPLHFHFALLVAVICALGYAVPFVGMIVAHIIAAILAIPQGGTMVASVTFEVFVLARIADNFLVPKVMSNSVGVSPIGVMFAVFAGGELFGLPGLLLGIPAAALLKVLFKYFVQPYVLRMQLGDAVADTAPPAPPPEPVIVKIRS